MENKMRMFKVMSALLLLLVIGNTFTQNVAAIDVIANPMESPSAHSSETPVLELPMACRLEATDSEMVYPAIVKNGTVILLGKIFIPENK